MQSLKRIVGTLFGRIQTGNRSIELMEHAFNVTCPWWYCCYVYLEALRICMKEAWWLCERQTLRNTIRMNFITCVSVCVWLLFPHITSKPITSCFLPHQYDKWQSAERNTSTLAVLINGYVRCVCTKCIMYAYLLRANVQTHWYDSVICSWTLLTSWISGNRPYQLARRDKHMPSTQSQQFSHCVCVRARAICMFGDCFNQSGSDWQFQHSNRMRIGARTVASGVCCYVKHTCGAYELTHFVQSSGAWVESIRLEEQKKNAHSTASYGLLIFRIFDRTRHVIGIFYSTYLYNWLMRLTLHRWNKNHELQYNVAIRAKNHLILKLQSSISSAYITTFATNCFLDKHNTACHWYSFDRWKLI